MFIFCTNVSRTKVTLLRTHVALASLTARVLSSDFKVCSHRNNLKVGSHRFPWLIFSAKKIKDRGGQVLRIWMPGPLIYEMYP